MPRTTRPFVKGIIKVNANIPLDPFMDTANVLATRLKDADENNIISDKALAVIEGWLAAHAYAIRDQQYSSRRTGQASAVFQGQTGMRLNSTYWGQMAISLDPTGNLGLWDSGANASVGILWLGSDPAPTQLEEE